MNKNVLKKGVSIRDLAHGLIPSMFDELFVEMNQVKEKKNRISETKTEFEKYVSDKGWKSPLEFYTELGYLDSLTVKRSRVNLTDELRTQVVVVLKIGGKTSRQISDEFGITEGMVDSIKKLEGLTKKRVKKLTLVKEEPTVPNLMEKVS